jgi:hypothetical protein
MLFPDPTQLSALQVSQAFAKTLDDIRESGEPTGRLMRIEETLRQVCVEAHGIIAQTPEADQWKYFSAVLDCAKGAGELAPRLLMAFFAPIREDGGIHALMEAVNQMTYSPAFGGLRSLIIDCCSQHQRPEAETNRAKLEDTVLALIENGKMKAAAELGITTTPMQGLERSNPGKKSEHWQQFKLQPLAYLSRKDHPLHLQQLAGATGCYSADLEEAILDAVADKMRAFFDHIQDVGARANAKSTELAQMPLFRQAAFLWGLSECMHVASAGLPRVVDILGHLSGVTPSDMDKIAEIVNSDIDNLGSEGFNKQEADWKQAFAVTFERARLRQATGESPWPDPATVGPDRSPGVRVRL